jgi:hypothetical protein
VLSVHLTQIFLDLLEISGQYWQAAVPHHPAQRYKICSIAQHGNRKATPEAMQGRGVDTSLLCPSPHNVPQSFKLKTSRFSIPMTGKPKRLWRTIPLATAQVGGNGFACLSSYEDKASLTGKRTKVAQ